MLNIISRNLSALGRLNAPGVGVLRGPWKRFNSLYCLKPFMDDRTRDALWQLREHVEERDPQLVKLMEKEVDVKTNRTIKAINKEYDKFDKHVIALPAEDGCNVWDAEIYKMMYDFMSKQYTAYCKRTQKRGLEFINNMINDISEALATQYPYRGHCSKWQIYRYFRGFWAISHGLWPSDKYIFEDMVVADLWRDWLQGHDLGQCLAEHDLSPQVVQCWFNVFETIKLIPKATSDNPMMCSMSPPEYYRHQINKHELWKSHFDYDPIKSKDEESSIDDDIKRLVYWLGVARRFDKKINTLPTEEYIRAQAYPK